MGYRGAVRPSEGLALAFFVHLIVAALVRPLPIARRLSAGLGAAAVVLVVVAIARLAPGAVRDWAPAGYLLAGYYLTGRTFVRPQPRVEAWLMAWDRRLLGDPAAWYQQGPRLVVGLLEAAYIGCFLLVPAGYAILASAGYRQLADPYWTIVAGAEYGSFAALPYLQTRPPWVLERLGDAAAASTRASVAFMKHATTGANTLPSGHAAGSVAVALAVIDAVPVAGTVLLILAITIAAATIVTRAHYVVDVITGAALAVIVWLVVR
jgi:membrane-associated phospholipid phosphatase